MADLAKVVDALAVLMMLVSGIYLYLASRPVPGALTLVGGGKTEREIKKAEGRRHMQSLGGLVLLILGSLVQILRLVGVLR